jgi:hypothetical protein
MLRPVAMAQGMTDMAYAKNQGLDLGVERTPDNTTPTSFRQWCEEVLSGGAVRNDRPYRTSSPYVRSRVLKLRCMRKVAAQIP